GVLYDRLTSVADLVPVKVHGGTQAATGRLLGDAAVLLGRPGPALSHYEAARAVCAGMRFRPELALVELSLAKLLLGHLPARSAEAVERLGRAIPEFEAMGMKPALDEARRLAGHLPGARRDFPHGLTAREVEVLRLIARGESNRQIAEEL